jgi:hypothetical protein
MSAGTPQIVTLYHDERHCSQGSMNFPRFSPCLRDSVVKC